MSSVEVNQTRRVGSVPMVLAGSMLLALGLGGCSMMGQPPSQSSGHGEMYLPPSGPGQTESSARQSSAAIGTGSMLLPPSGPGHVEAPYNQSGTTGNTGGMLLPATGPGTRESPNNTVPAPPTR